MAATTMTITEVGVLATKMLEIAFCQGSFMAQELAIEYLSEPENMLVFEEVVRTDPDPCYIYVAAITTHAERKAEFMELAQNLGGDDLVSAINDELQDNNTRFAPEH